MICIMFLTVGKLIMGWKFKNIIYFENKLAFVLEKEGLIVCLFHSSIVLLPSITFFIWKLYGASGGKLGTISAVSRVWSWG